MTLNVIQPRNSSITETICQGQTFTFGNQVLSNSGTFVRTISASTGCDSVITLTLNVISSSTTNINATICDGETYTVGSNTYDQSGTYNITLLGSNGCDSTINLDLFVAPTQYVSVNAAICQGQTYVLGSQSLTAAGTYFETFSNSFGCDSTVELILNVNPTPSSPVITANGPTAICSGSLVALSAQPNTYGNNYRWFNNGVLIANQTASTISVTSAGNYTVLVLGAGGCSSAVSTPITIIVNQSNPAVIINQPSNQSVVQGVAANFSVSANNATAYQWLVSVNNSSFTTISNGGIYSGATSSTLTVTTGTILGSNYRFRVRVSGTCTNPVTSNIAVLSVTSAAPPVVLSIGSDSICNSTTQVSIPIVVNGFTNIASLNAAISLNISGITFTGLSGSPSSISGLSASQTGNTLNLSWNTTANQSLPNGSVLTIMNFVTASTGTITWNPSSVTLRDQSNNILSRTLNNGQIIGRTIQNATITGLPSIVCINNSASTLTGNPANGTFSGPGISGNTFNPTLAGIGTHTITYTSTSNGCQTVATATISVLPQPTADAGSDVTICQGQTVFLQANGGNSYLWTNGPNSSLYQVTPSATTTYYVTVTNSNGCSADDSVTVFVNTSVPVDIAGNRIQNVCTGGNGIQLQASNSASFLWLPSTGLSASNIANPTANPGSTTTYIVYGTSSNGCLSTDTVTIVVNPRPTLTFPAVSALCANSPAVTLGATPSGGTYSGTGVSGNDFSPAIAGVGSHVITYSFTDANGCSNTINRTITVNPLPSGTAGPDLTICAGQSTVLSASGGSNYQWTALNGTTVLSTTASVVVSPTSTSSYVVRMANSQGCAIFDTVQVSVTTAPELAINGGASGASLAICSGSSVTLRASNGTTPYIWSPATGLSSTTGDSVVASPTVTTTYTVTSITGTCVSTATVTVVVNPRPTLTFPAVAALCANSPAVTLGATPSGGTYSGTGVSGNDFSPAIAGVGSHTITYSFTDANGCSNTINRTITVNPLPSGTAGPDLTICAGQSTVLSASGGSNYQWTALNGTTVLSTSASVVVSPTSTSSYVVRMANSQGCAIFDTVQVTVTAAPELAINGGASGASLAICSGSSVTLRASNGTTPYIWSPATGLSSTTGDSVVASPTVTTTYTVTSITGTCVSTATVTVVVNPRPTLTFPAVAALC
ncbi:MAG: beta strand repeat-containing protein, partial [Cyanobium sp.]